jgi:hypothetical protein
MPFHVSYLKPEMMHAEIRLADPASYVRLLHAFKTIHDTFSHDRDLITFFNDDDAMSFHLNASVNYVSFGPTSADESERRWTENIGIGEILHLLLSFMQRDYAALEAYRWLSDGAWEDETAGPGQGGDPAGA